MDRRQELKTALDRYGSTELREYLESNHTDDIKSDILRLIKEERAPAEEDNDLKTFTMAAMQGFCSGLPNLQREGLTNQDVDFISASAVLIARATLTELSKQQ